MSSLHPFVLHCLLVRHVFPMMVIRHYLPGSGILGENELAFGFLQYLRNKRALAALYEAYQVAKARAPHPFFVLFAASPARHSS